MRLRRIIIESKVCDDVRPRRLLASVNGMLTAVSDRISSNVLVIEVLISHPVCRRSLSP